MADPAPSAPLPVGPERRVSPADQMAALTGEPVEISQPEADEPAEDRDVTQDRQSENLSKTAAFGAAPDAAPSSADPPKPAQSPTQSQAADAPVSPPAPSAAAASSKLDRNPAAAQPTPPDSRTAAGSSSPKAQDHPNEASRSPQGVAPLNGAAMVVAALTGGLRRPEPPAPAAPAAVSKAATSNAAASSDARAPTPSLLDRLAVKSILDNLRRPEERAPAPQTAPTPGATAAGSSRSLGCAGRHGEGRLACQRSPRQAWRLHRRPHASATRRGGGQGRHPGRDRCSCLAGGAGTAGDDRDPHEDPRRR